jgi:hypothetical protein
MPTRRNRRRLQISLKGLLAIVSLCAIVLAVGAFFYQRHRRIELRVQTLQGVQVLVACYKEYDLFYDTLPPAVEYDQEGRPVRSWRFGVLQTVGIELPDGPNPQYDLPWDAPENLRWGRETAGLCCFQPAFARAEPSTEADFVAVTGPGTAFDREKVQRLAQLPADTILLVEVRDSDIHWMQPGDLDVRTMPRTMDDPTGKGISGNFAEGVHVVFADGQVWLLEKDTPFEKVEKFLKVEDAYRHDRDGVLGEYCLGKW